MEAGDGIKVVCTPRFEVRPETPPGPKLAERSFAKLGLTIGERGRGEMFSEGVEGRCFCMSCSKVALSASMSVRSEEFSVRREDISSCRVEMVVSRVAISSSKVVMYSVRIALIQHCNMQTDALTDPFCDA